MGDITFLLAFGYGLLSFLSPCILPLIPVYLTNLTGPEAAAAPRARWSTLLHSASFVAGFTVVFSLWGAGAGLLGSAFSTHLLLVQRIAGGVLIAFGLLMLASLKIPWLNYEKRLRFGYGTRAGFLRSVVIGAIFPVAWTPCVSWVLGGIIMLAGASQTALKGASLLAVYSLGLGLPFLVIGLGFDYVKPFLRKIGRFSTILYMVSSILLIGVGVLILTNKVVWFLGAI